MNLIKNDKYKDEGSFRINLIRLKSKFMLKNVKEMERLLEWSILHQLDDVTLDKLVKTAIEKAGSNEQFTTRPTNRPNQYQQNLVGEKLILQKKQIIQQKWTRLDKADNLNPEAITFPAYYEKIFPKDPKVRLEIINQLNLIKLRQKTDTSFRVSDFKAIHEIEAKTGQVTKGKEPIPGENLFSDFNYGDYVVVFHNHLVDFMYKDVEDNIEFIRLVERKNKRQTSTLGQLSTTEIQANRLEDEKFEVV